MESRMKTLKKRHINWILSCHDPTPLEFFRLIQPTHKARAFEKYGKTLDQAIDCCKDPIKKSTLQNVKEFANCNSDWDVWLAEKRAKSIRNEIHETNVEVHRELNLVVRNSGKQKNNDTNYENGEGSNSNNINEEECAEENKFCISFCNTLGKRSIDDIQDNQKQINESEEYSEEYLTDELAESFEILFNESNEEILMQNIDEETLEEEIKLPLANGDPSKDPLKYILSSGFDVSEAFHNYQTKIPKCRKISTPAYWGILDLTNESLYGCKDFTEDDVKQLNQEFSNSIGWINAPTEKSVQQYFDSNCKKVRKKLEKLNCNIQFIKNNMHSFQRAMPEEQLKMSYSFPLFRGIFTSDHIVDVWGETQALATNDARNEKRNPFKKARMGRKVDMKGVLIKTPNKFEVIYGEVSGGLGQFGSSANLKKRFLDKVKLMVTMRDSLNSLLKICKHTLDKQRMGIVVYGWLQVGLELSFYAIDWIGDGLYRFGLLDQCILPSDKADCKIMEDAYCILKTLEIKLLQTETAVRKLLFQNTKGKRRRTITENEPKLNVNRTPNK